MSRVGECAGDPAESRRPRGLAIWGGVALAALVATGAASGTALPPIRVTPDLRLQSIADQVELFEDATGVLGIAAVASGAAEGRFRTIAGARELQLGRTVSAYWIRFRLDNPTSRPSELVLEIRYPQLDRIELYAPDLSVTVAGDTLPFDRRPLALRHFVFPLRVPAESTQTYYLRVRSSGLLIVPLRLASKDSYLETADEVELLLGLLYGIFAGTALYTLLLWVMARAVACLYLVGQTAAVGLGLACLDGLAFQLWPRATGWHQWSIFVFIFLTCLFTVQFTRSLVGTAKPAPRFDRGLRLLGLATVVVAVAAAAIGFQAFFVAALLWLLFVGFVVTATVFWFAGQGVRSARIYAVAWGLLLPILVLVLAATFAWVDPLFDALLSLKIFASAQVLLAAIALTADLSEARRRLAASEKKFARAFRSSPDGLTLSTLEDGVFLEMNAAFERISGYSREEAIGRSSLDLGIWRPEDRRRVAAAFKKAIPVHQVEGMIFHRDGREVPVQISGELIELDGQRVVLAIVRDISERYRAAEQRERLIAELEAKNTELERFTYTASHDLRSPLVTILGFLDLLERDAGSGDGERIGADIDRIRAASERMRRLLDELLELSRAGRVSSPMRRVSLKEVAEEAASLVRRSLDESGGRLDIVAELPVVEGDRGRLLQVFQNLFDNSIRFSGDRPPEIDVVSWQRGDRWVISVRDRGLGIDSRYHESVFELFRRLRPTVEGTGVGLALVRRIVENHGGTVWAESEGEGKGTAICFELPAAGAGGRSSVRHAGPGGD